MSYEILKNIIRFLPLAILVLVFIRLLGTKWYFRLGVVVLVGWITVAITTLLFWWYSFEYAPNEAIRHEVAMKDGAPRVFGVLFGWVYASVLLLVFETVRTVYLLLNKLFPE